MYEIFEISNQAFDLLQNTDSKEIDSWNWNEWLQLFKDDVNIYEKAIENQPLIWNEEL